MKHRHAALIKPLVAASDTLPAMLLAVLHRHAGVACLDQDVFVNVVGGVKVSETSADLALLLAMVSSLRDRPLPRDPINNPDWKYLDILNEVNQAKSVGIDGFAVDIVAASQGTNMVSGGTGNDRMIGGAGNDTLIGEDYGNVETLAGGLGDVFGSVGDAIGDIAGDIFDF